MLPRVLSVALPLFIYTALVLVVWGIYRERAKLDRWTLILAAGALLASLAFRPAEHLLFFDEDIYIQIASNMSHAPVAQLTILGGPNDIKVSTYYKEPVGFPVLLSLIFAITGTHESVAFIVARLFYALTVVAVYLLALEILKTRAQAITAAVVFAAAPACFAFSSSAGSDLPAALFATLGVWGAVSGNGMLAAGALAMAAQIRLDMIALAPLILIADRIPMKWKAGMGALITAEILHVSWVLSIAPKLAQVENVTSAFSPSYIPGNLWTNLKYLLNPTLFPIAATVLAVATLYRSTRNQQILLAWIALISAVYLLFFAGSFEINPRYSIQITIPIVLLAVSVANRKAILATLLFTAALAELRRPELPSYVQNLASDHATAVQFAQRLEPTDLVISTEPEVFINQGRYAMNAVFASEQPDRVREQLGNFKRVFYYSGARTSLEGTEEWKADRRVKSDYELHLVDSREFGGRRIALYQLLELVHGETR